MCMLAMLGAQHDMAVNSSFSITLPPRAHDISCLLVMAYLQVGVIEDTDNRNRLAKLLRFYSSKSDDSMTSLEEYASRMKEGQKGIYYMVRTSCSGAGQSWYILQQSSLLGSQACGGGDPWLALSMHCLA